MSTRNALYRFPGSMRFFSTEMYRLPCCGGKFVFAKKPAQYVSIHGSSRSRGLYWGWHDWKILVKYPASSPTIQDVSKSIILECNYISWRNIFATYFTVIMPEISWSSFCSSMLHAAFYFCIGIPCCQNISSAGDLGPQKRWGTVDPKKNGWPPWLPWRPSRRAPRGMRRFYQAMAFGGGIFGCHVRVSLACLGCSLTTLPGFQVLNDFCLLI